jgi:hypothetical protein
VQALDSQSRDKHATIEAAPEQVACGRGFWVMYEYASKGFAEALADDADPDILDLICEAGAKWGVGFELKMIAQSWGDTLDDYEMLLIMMGFVETGVWLGRPLRMLDPLDPQRAI